ncbi:histone-like nucleoid-structuring protein Lsr2 [Streptosporangium sandarakinum]|uniref:histone-like nucleoid-structuring protein Lsr2 n=1 Tax=Streptosporangium sandarakinum TaxID=1260955 RepID=UPI003416640C
MAQKVILVDDLDHSEGTDVARREFSLLNRTFAIDLSDANQRRLREALGLIEKVLESSREVRQASRARRPADPPVRLRGHTTTDVREWAREQGLEVPVRGRVPEEVLDRFLAAHPDAVPDREDAPDRKDAPGREDAPERAAGTGERHAGTERQAGTPGRRAGAARDEAPETA